MAQIIWDGNKNWENVWDGKQPWDREIEEKSIPENAVLIDRPDDIIKASIPYMIIPCIICFVAIFTKKAQSDEFIFNLIYGLCRCHLLLAFLLRCRYMNFFML